MKMLNLFARLLHVDPPTLYFFNFIILLDVGKKNANYLTFFFIHCRSFRFRYYRLCSRTKILNCRISCDRNSGHPPILEVKRVWCNLSMAGAPVCDGTVGRAVSCFFFHFLDYTTQFQTLTDKERLT